MLEVKRDGSWAWLVLFCTVCTQTILGGICLSSGLFYVIFADALGSNKIETSWLCSLPLTMWFVSSPIGSFLTNRYGCRKSAFFGGLLAGCGLSLGYFASSLGYLYFSHGFLTGLGFGINYTASMTALNMYFDRYKTLATGIASIGHNAGLVLYAEITIYLQSIYGWRGMLLIHGAVAFNLCTCACAMLPLPNDSFNFGSDSFDSHSKEKITKESTNRKKRKRKSIFLYRKLSFSCFCASNVFTNVGFGIYLILLPSYSRKVGFTDKNYGTSLVVYGLANVVGKVIFSFLGHHPKMDETVLYTVCLTFTGIFTLLTPFFLTQVGMLVLAGGSGFFYAVTGALLQAVIFNIVGFERFADGVGMSLPFKAFGNLIGGPLAGSLLTWTGRYSSAFYTSGVCMVLASALMIQTAFCRKRGNGSEGHIGSNNINEIEIGLKEDTKHQDLSTSDERDSMTR